MSDFAVNNAPDWLERELTHELAPVTAPDSLRFRLSANPPQRKGFVLAPVFAAALFATVAFATVAGTVWKTGQSQASRTVEPERPRISLTMASHDTCMLCHRGAALLVTP